MLQKRIKAINDLVKVVRNAMKNGLDLNDDATRTDVFDDVAFRVRFLDENEERSTVPALSTLQSLNMQRTGPVSAAEESQPFSRIL